MARSSASAGWPGTTPRRAADPPGQGRRPRLRRLLTGGRLPVARAYSGTCPCWRRPAALPAGPRLAGVDGGSVAGRGRRSPAARRPTSGAVAGGPARTPGPGSPATAPATCGVSSRFGASHSGWPAGSGSGSVTSSGGPQPTGLQLGQQRVGVGDRAAGGVDEQRAVRHPGQERGVDHARVASVSGTISTTTSAPGSRPAAPRRRARTAPCGVRAVRATIVTADVERRHRRLISRRRRRRRSSAPACRPARRYGVRAPQPAAAGPEQAGKRARGEDRRRPPTPRWRVVHAARVTERPPVGQPTGPGVGAGGSSCTTRSSGSSAAMSSVQAGPLRTGTRGPSKLATSAA